MFLSPMKIQRVNPSRSEYLLLQRAKSLNGGAKLSEGLKNTARVGGGMVRTIRNRGYHSMRNILPTRTPRSGRANDFSRVPGGWNALKSASSRSWIFRAQRTISRARRRRSCP